MICFFIPDFSPIITFQSLKAKYSERAISSDNCLYLQDESALKGHKDLYFSRI